MTKKAEDLLNQGQIVDSCLAEVSSSNGEEASNAEQGLNFLKTLFGRCSQGYVEFRPIPSELGTRKWRSVDKIKIPLLPADKNIYIGVATRKKKKGTKEDIIEIPAVWVDIDFKDVETDETTKRIDEFNLKPSIVVESGNGLHVYWLLELPAGIGDVLTIESINKRLAIQLHGDQASSDAAHILRLPGTYNQKYDHKPLVKISSINKDSVYKLADFDFLPEPPNTSQTMSTGTSSEWCEDTLKGVSHGKRHDSTVALAGLCLQKKVTENDAKELLAIWNLKNNPPDSEKELLETITDVYKRYGQSESSEGSSSATTSSDYSQVIEESIMSVADFMQKQITPKTYIVDPWLKQGDLALISAPRGVGKTWLALSIAKTATRDFSFGKWENGIPTGCLYIDGEMAEYELQERLIDLHMESPKAEATFKLISADNMRSRGVHGLNLTNQSCRDGIAKYLKNHPEFKLLIIDNLASLTPGLDENIKKDWDNINQWLLGLRANGIAVVMIHHTGKGGEQRGTSAREDNLDISIKLKRPEGYSQTEGALFDVEFTKGRSIYGDSAKPFRLHLEKTTGQLAWTVETGETKREQIISMSNDGIGQKEISKKLECTESYVSQVVKKAKQMAKVEENKDELTVSEDENQAIQT